MYVHYIHDILYHMTNSVFVCSSPWGAHCVPEVSGCCCDSNLICVSLHALATWISPDTWGATPHSCYLACTCTDNSLINLQSLSLCLISIVSSIRGCTQWCWTLWCSVHSVLFYIVYPGQPTPLEQCQLLKRLRSQLGMHTGWCTLKYSRDG